MIARNTQYSMTLFVAILFTIAFALGAPCVLADDGGTVTLSTPLSVERGVGTVTRAGRISLFDEVYRQPEGAEHIVLEVERYEDILWQPAVRTTAASEVWMEQVEKVGAQKSYSDEAASGGKYLERVSSASYPFYVSEPGEYTVWMRLWRPGRQNWVFQYQVDQGGTNRIKLDADEYKQYYWQKVGVETLDKGSHTFLFWNLHGGKRIDKIVMTRKEGFTPEGMGPDETPRGGMREGSVTMARFVPSDVVRWEAVEVPRLNESGAVRLEVSFDSGRTWQKVNAEQPLPETPGAVADSIAVRMYLERGDDGKAPEVNLPRVRFTAPAAAYPTVGSGSVRYTFNARTGGLSGMELLKPKHVVAMPRGVDVDPLRLMYRTKADPTHPIWLEFEDFRVTARRFTGREARITYKARNLPIEVVTTYTLNRKGYLDASVEIANNFRHDVQEVEFPRLGSVRIGSDSANDTIIWPVGTGKKYNEPTSKNRLTARYPTAVVGYFDLYDNDAGLYMGSHDPRLYSTQLEAEPSPSRTWMSFVITKRDRIEPGETRRFPLALGVHAGDWHTGADWYKAFYRDAFGDAVWPEWMKESDGWIFANVAFRRPPYRHLDEFIFRKAIRLGFKHVQIWGTTTSGSCPMYYMPPPDLGGAEGFAEGNAWWKKRGGVVGYYMCPNYVNSYFYHDVCLDYFGTPWERIPEWGRPHDKLKGDAWQWIVENAHYGPDRTEPQPELERWAREINRKKGTSKWNVPPRTQQRMAALSREFTDWFEYWVVDKYVGDFNCGSVYLDTMHYGAEVPEFNPHLGMFGEGHGGWARNRMAKRIRDRGRELNPEWLPIEEMQTDAYGMYVAYMIGASAKDSEMLRYTHPDHVCFEGQTGSGWGAKRFKRFNSMWLYGNRLDHRENEAWAVETIRMRKWITRWINASRFVDDLGLDTGAKELRGKLHRVTTDDGSRGVFVALWNTARREWPAGNKTITDREWSDYTVTLDLEPLARVDGIGADGDDFVPRRAILIDMNRMPKSIPFETFREDGRAHVRFKVPPRQINGVLLVREAHGVRSLLTRVDQRDFEALDVHLFNPGTRTIEATVTPRPQSVAVAFDETLQSVRVEPGKTATVSFPYRGGVAPNTSKIVLVDVKADGETRTLRAGAYPFMEDASFETDDLVNATEKFAAHGRRAWQLNFRGNRSMVLEPSTKYRLSFEIRGDGKGGGGRVLFDHVIPKNRVDGIRPEFAERFEYAGDGWTTVTLTFLTPEMYYDSGININVGKGNTAYVDDFRLEKLPEGAAVDHEPRYFEQ